MTTAALSAMATRGEARSTQAAPPWITAISTVEYGDPKTQPDLLRRLSPIDKVDQLKAATIVLHGANDANVPVVEAEHVVNSRSSSAIFSVRTKEMAGVRCPIASAPGWK